MKCDLAKLRSVRTKATVQWDKKYIHLCMNRIISDEKLQ